MAAQTFLFNFNEDRFFLGESKCDKFNRKACTVSYPPLDHLNIINNLHKGQNINMALTPQRPGTFYGSNKCRCTFLPPLKQTLDEEIQCCQPKKSLFSKRKSTIPRRSRSRHGSLEKDEQLEEIKCMLKTLLQEKNEDEEDETEYLGRRSTMRKPSQYKPMSRRRHCSFIADECRKCSQKICLRCRMTLDSCCCGIPNFLFCKDCEGKTRAPDCSMKDPFACRKCDQKICLVCKEPLECCPCPKPNFLFCRMCDARMRTRCCIPAD
uniref:Putative serine/threonine-protein kinase DDB_G0278665 n=1 Tax=Lygus hesperus TaxID=30085 RepID=A0A0A9YQ99_LYGHE